MRVRKLISVAVIFSFLLGQWDVGFAFEERGKKLTIAVVDFTNTKKDPALDYLVKGIPESISTYLGKKGEVHVVERSRLEAALNELKLQMSDIVDEQTAVQLGKQVGANAVLVGSFLQIGDVIRINSRLIDIETGEIIAAEQVQGAPGKEIFGLMDQTAEAMWEKLVGRPVEIQPIPIAEKRKKEPNLEVYIGYGLFYPSEETFENSRFPVIGFTKKILRGVGLKISTRNCSYDLGHKYNTFAINTSFPYFFGPSKRKIRFQAVPYIGGGLGFYKLTEKTFVVKTNEWGEELSSGYEKKHKYALGYNLCSGIDFYVSRWCIEVEVMYDKARVKMIEQGVLFPHTYKYELGGLSVTLKVGLLTGRHAR